MKQPTPSLHDRPARLTSAEHTRHALVLAALKLFGEKGFEGTTTREIAVEAKANIGSISYHFGGKEGLRTACADHIVALLGGIAGTALDFGSAHPAGGTPAEARALLRRALETMTGFIIASPDAQLIVKFVLRELTHPTVALDRIYDGIFAPVHGRLCGLWQAATGEPAESDATKLAVFTMIGQVVYFRIAGEAVRRRMGWSEIGRLQASAIADAVGGNLDAVLAARQRGKDLR